MRLDVHLKNVTPVVSKESIGWRPSRENVGKTEEIIAVALSRDDGALDYGGDG